MSSKRKGGDGSVSRRKCGHMRNALMFSYDTQSHQAIWAWAPGTIHVQGVSFSQLSMNPFSLAATNTLSRTITTSSLSLAGVESDWDAATKVRVFFAPWIGMEGAMEASLGR